MQIKWWMFCIRRKDKCIKIWDKTSLTCKKSITALNDWVNVLTEVKKGLLASGGRDNLVKLWSLETFECTRTVEWHCNTIISLIKEEDDKLLSASCDNTINIWNLWIDIFMITKHINYNMLIYYIYIVYSFIQ